MACFTMPLLSSDIAGTLGLSLFPSQFQRGIRWAEIRTVTPGERQTQDGRAAPGQARPHLGCRAPSEIRDRANLIACRRLVSDALSRSADLDDLVRSSRPTLEYNDIYPLWRGRSKK